MRKRDSERKGETARERERCRIWMLYFLFLTGIMGALAPFSYLVII